MLIQNLLRIHERFTVMEAKRNDRIAFDLGVKRRDLRDFQELLSFVGRKRKPKRKLEHRVARRIARA